ncbi:DNA repair protein Rad5p [[Candida] jaroonii]|uniref:DNA repair protein Rad5p n=1 Tax=[Candida] jaroonii TaxID=467808 RepID=A0ACA9Y2T5_9ASCO|nr:DNA repair protein Rad5p [[Candida] jaroonii]
MSREKRRFFNDPGESIDVSEFENSVLFNSPNNDTVENVIKEENVVEPVKDDFTTFQVDITNVLGKLPFETLKSLYDRFEDKEDKLMLALDHHLKKEESPKPNEYKVIPPISLENNPKRKRTRGIQIPFAYAKRSNSSLEQLLLKKEKSSDEEDEWKKYVGTLYADAFATRPYMKPLAYAKEMTIRRIKPKSLSGKDKKQDSAVVRIYTRPHDEFPEEREIGRLKEDLTRIFAPLLDLKLISLVSSVMVETKKRLSTGDAFYIKIDVFLTKTAFTAKPEYNELDNFKKNDVKARFNFGAETESESFLRLRQYAISRLFNKLQIKSVKFKDNKEVMSTQFEMVESPNKESIDLEVEETEETFEENESELNLDQLQSFYSANQQSEILKALPYVIPPKENFGLELRNYQKHGLSWMLAREKELDILKMLVEDNDDTISQESIDEIKLMDEGVMNPLWKTFKWPKAEAKDNLDKYFYGNIHSGELSLEKPLIKSSVKGGILSDEMGLGKTISALSLINSVPYDTGIIDDPSYAFQTTLVIVPMSLLTQWEKEFKKCNQNSNHRCMVYYGQQSFSDLSNVLIGKTKHIPIMVVTTYGTILSEYTKIEKRRDPDGNLPKTGLFSVKFFRIIIDEGHTIRNRTAKTSRSIFELKASRKWILTGTPVINRLDDLYSLVKYLELEPWNNFSYWKTFITLPFEQKQIKDTLDVVKTILEPIFLRRTKDMKDSDGNPLVVLPPKEVEIEEIKFNDRELKLYNWFKDKASKSFRESLRSGEVLRKYTQILTHILRLRQICCHQDLISKVVNDMQEEVDEEMKDEDLEIFLKELNEDDEKFKDETEINQKLYSMYQPIYNQLDQVECSICTSTSIDMNEMIVTECKHIFCITCLLEHIEFQKNSNQPSVCPNCRDPISKYKLFKIRNRITTKAEYKFHTNKDILEDWKFQVYLYDPTKTSSKIQALINHINGLRAQNLNEPIIVFSQFSSFLDIIENELNLQIGNKYVKCLKFDGRLKMTEREKLLQEFNEYKSSPNTLTILLLSLKAGGVGLNLTSASRAFMMDPWWSPSIEDQAIDRLHRIGQQNNVKVVRFIMENSIEIKMLKIQEMKKSIGEIVGVEEEEKRRRRIEEIQILFEE